MKTITNISDLVDTIINIKNPTLDNVDCAIAQWEQLNNKPVPFKTLLREINKLNPQLSTHIKQLYDDIQPLI